MCHSSYVHPCLTEEMFIQLKGWVVAPIGGCPKYTFAIFLLIFVSLIRLSFEMSTFLQSPDLLTRAQQEQERTNQKNFPVFVWEDKQWCHLNAKVHYCPLETVLFSPAVSFPPAPRVTRMPLQRHQKDQTHKEKITYSYNSAKNIPTKNQGINNCLGGKKKKKRNTTHR